jgi:hypothetical protein
MGHQVDAVLVERLVGDLGHGASHPLVTADCGQRREEAVAGDAELREQAAGGDRGTLLNHRQHQVLDGDVFVLQALRLVLGAQEDLLQPVRDVDLAGFHARARDAGPAGQLALDLGHQRGGRHVHPGEQARDEPLGLLEQGEQQVLAVRLLMAEAERLGLGALQRLL